MSATETAVGSGAQARSESSWFASPRRYRLLAIAGPVGLVLAWFGLAHSGWFSPLIVVPPQEVGRAILELISTGELWTHLGQSFHRLVSGFVAGALLALVWGTLMAVSRTVEQAFSPLFNAVRQVPSIAFIPLLILVFGIGETFKVLIVAKAAFFPIALATYEGIRQVSSGHLEVARLYRCSPWQRLRHVIVPAASSSLLTGLRLGLSRAWGVLVAAELFAADFGVGQMMEAGRQMFRLDIVFVGVLITGIVGFTFDRGLQRLEHRLTRWRGTAVTA